MILKIQVGIGVVAAVRFKPVGFQRHDTAQHRKCRIVARRHRYRFRGIGRRCGEGLYGQPLPDLRHDPHLAGEKIVHQREVGT